MSERPRQEYGARAPDAAPERRFTEEPAGPLELLVMALGRELHDRERPGEDWFGLVGSSVSSFCRRACEARSIDWNWMRDAISRERLAEDITRR
jgi:hypothetical protein